MFRHELQKHSQSYHLGIEMGDHPGGLFLAYFSQSYHLGIEIKPRRLGIGIRASLNRTI